MDKDTRLPLTSVDVVGERMEALRELFPEVFAEGKIDFARLKEALGDFADDSAERYGLSWAGKADAKRAFQSLSSGTLVPLRDESVNFDSTENLIIEGDNLEVLKLLQQGYHGKVNMIYIDPPYNTGNEFIYPDNYREGLDGYLRYTGQVTDDGFRVQTNTESGGRFHSRWLSMMYPRLFLARNLLADDGAIFISIDDHELYNLKQLCDEVFGEENYKGTIVRATGQTTGQDSGGLGSSFDYILAYFRQPDVEFSGLPLDDSDLDRYQMEDGRGKYALWQLRKTGSNDRREDRPNMYFAIKNPDGEDVWPLGPTGYDSCWRFDPKGYKRLLEEDYIVWKKRKRGETEEWWPYVKTYLEGRTKRPSPLWVDLEGSKKASIDIRTLLGGSVFSNPKPVGMIARLLQILPQQSEDCLVLDFFAGSGTTAHAVLDMNRQDGGTRKFILVQLPEPLDPKERDQKLGSDFCDSVNRPRNIAEITKERVRRVIKQIDEESNGKLALGDERGEDRGFRVLKLTSSNFKLWNPEEAPKDAEGLAEQLRLYADHVLPGRSQEDILFELLLKAGVPLGARIEKVDVAGQSAFDVADGHLLICLEDEITEETLRAMIERKPEQILCLDNAFKGNDQLKTNTVLETRSHGIKFHTV